MDVRPPEWFVGLMAVGDEIKAVDGALVTPEWTLEAAAAAMSGKKAVELTILPVEMKAEEVETVLV